MEKREFNKIVKQKLLFYGFEKTGPRDYAKEALDGITKIIVQVPDETIFLYNMVKEGDSMYRGSLNAAIEGQSKAREILFGKLH